MNISERLSEILKNEDITAYTISQKTGIDQSTLSRIITGKTKKPSEKIIKILAKYLNVSEKWLKTGVGNMSLSQSESPPLKLNKDFMASDEFEKKLLALIQAGEIYPAFMVKNLQTERDELLKKNALLEEKVKELGKTIIDAHPGDNVKCAGAG